MKKFLLLGLFMVLCTDNDDEVTDNVDLLDNCSLNNAICFCFVFFEDADDKITLVYSKN